MDLSQIPALTPPPGVIPNFVHPQNEAYILVVVISICFTLLVFFVSLRFYAKIWVLHAFGWDDVSCAFATIGTLAYGSTLLSSLRFVGRHMWDIPFIAFTDEFLRELVLVYEMLYGPAIFFAKLSLLLLYLRIFSPDRWTRYLIYLGIISSFALYLATSITFGALCLPRGSETWAAALYSARCKSTTNMTYIQGIFNVVSDFYILFIPIPVVLKLHLPMQKKIGVVAIFMTGLLACIASALGLYYRIVLAHDPDFTWREVPVGSLVIIELSTGTMCGCMPYLTSFFRRWTFKTSQLSLLKSIKSGISNLFSRGFHSTRRSSSYDRANSDSGNEHYLETRILGSVSGKGKFMGSKHSTQREWLNSTVVAKENREATPIPEEWNRVPTRSMV